MLAAFLILLLSTLNVMRSAEAYPFHNRKTPQPSDANEESDESTASTTESTASPSILDSVMTTLSTKAMSKKIQPTSTPANPTKSAMKTESTMAITKRKPALRIAPANAQTAPTEISPPTTKVPITEAPTNQSPTSTIGAVTQFTLQQVSTTSTQAAPAMTPTPIQQKPRPKAPKQKHPMKIFREGEKSKHADLETKKQELPKAKEHSKTEREDFAKHQAKLNSLNRELDYRARTLDKLLSNARISHGDRLILEELKGKLENARNLEDIAEKENAIMEYQKLLAIQGVKNLANNGKFNEDQAHIGIGVDNYIANHEFGHQKLEDALDRLIKVLSGEGFRNKLHILTGLYNRTETAANTQHHVEKDFDESVGEDDDYEDHDEYFLILEDFLASFPVPVPIPIPVPVPLPF